MRERERERGRERKGNEGFVASLKVLLVVQILVP